MTPTEQDKELQEKVATIVEYWDFSPLQDEDSRIERLNNEIMQLITADRKRVALEARISILEDVYDDDRPLKTSMDIKKRIAELKAQRGRTANDMTCIKRYGARALQSAYHVSTFRDGACSCCGEQTRVTEARDFFYPDERALKLLRQYITKGKG